MNLQEREQLSLFLQQLTQVQASQKDTEADALIREACARQPDAGYLLVQRAMQLEQALEATKLKCTQLQAELDKSRDSTQSSFLHNAWGSAPVAPLVAPPGALLQSRAQGVVPATASPAAAPAPSTWGAGMLGTVATTAAGVVAGSFLYSGISSLMGHHGHSGVAATDSSAKAVTSQAESQPTYHGFDSAGKDDTVAFADSDSGWDEVA